MRKKIMIIISVIISLIILSLAGYYVYSKNNKKTDTFKSEEFAEIMRNNGFRIHDATTQYTEDVVSSANVAYQLDGNEITYQLDYIIFINEKSAKNAFLVNKNDFKENKKDDDKEDSKSNDTYSKYALTTKDTYMIVIRRKNTLLYAKVDGSYKNDVNKIIKKLNY